MVLCDFAGQQHFHRTHSIFFDPSNTVYIMVVNGRLSEEQIFAECRYWLAFLSASSPAGSRPVVVMVISRVDVCPTGQLDRLMSHVSSTLRSLFNEQLDIQPRYFVLDCRKSQSTEMKEFRAFIGQTKSGLLKVIFYNEIPRNAFIVGTTTNCCNWPQSVHSFAGSTFDFSSNNSAVLLLKIHSCLAKHTSCNPYHL